MTRTELIKAFEMRIDGYTYEAISHEVGYTRQNIEQELKTSVAGRKHHSIYPNISAEIKKHGGTIKEFSKRVGLSTPTMSGIIQGKNCTLATLQKIADFTGKSIDYLLER